MRTPKITGYGPKDAKILIVGPSPSTWDMKANRPFAGPDGSILRSILLATGINPKSVRYVNMVEEVPPRADLGQWFLHRSDKVRPNNLKVIEGLEALHNEIKTVNPNVIVAMGDFPLWILTGVNTVDKREGTPKGISDWRGSVIKGSEFTGGRKVLITYHPSFIVRNYPALPLLESDIRKLKVEAEFPEIKRRPRKINLNPQGAEREILLQQLMDEEKPISFDIEYTPTTGNLICIGFSNNPEEATTFAIRSGADLNDARRVLESGRDLVAQNAMFDCSILEHWYNIECFKNLKHDTMLGMHSAYIELPKDLGTLCSIYTDQPCYWTDLERGWWNKSQTEDWRTTTMIYNAKDAYVTAEVHEVQMNEELIDPRTRATYDFEMSLMGPLWRMSKRGIRIDKKGLDAYKHELTVREAELATALKSNVGYAVNVKSGKQMADLFFGPEGLGLKAKKFTPGGRAQSDDPTLVKMLSKATELQREVIEIIRGIRACRDLQSKFLSIKFDKDHRMRAMYNIGGTKTGRLASRKFIPTQSGGNLQNIPREKRVRRLVTPDPGYTFFYNDLKSAESYVVAQLTNDPLMIELHEPGGRPHEVTASMLFDIPIEEIGKDSVERALGKMTRHACNYMMGARQFMDNINAKSEETGIAIDAAMANKLRNGYMKLHPGLEEWWFSINAQLYATRVLHNLFGRPRQFFARLSSALPAAIAYIPQGTVGDLVNKSLVVLDHDEELHDYGFQMQLQVHDAIGGQVKTEYVLPAMRRYQEICNIPLTSPVTGKEFIIPLDISVGPNWADVEELDITKVV